MKTKTTTLLTIASILIVTLAMYAPAASASTGTSDGNWSMWRRDPSHSSTAASGPSNFTLAWNYSTAGAVISSPSIVDGVVYVGSQDTYLYALDADSGALVWKFKTNDYIVSSPAVADGKVYTGGDDGYVYCIDAQTGEMQWKTFVNGDVEYTYGSLVLKSSPAVVDGIVYVGSLDGYLYALNADSGDIVWKYNTDGFILSSPAVSDGAVYFTSEAPGTGVLFKLDAAVGSMIWALPIPYEHQFTGGTEMMGSPSVAGGMVFVPADLRTYYGVNAETGEVAWTFTEPDAAEFIVSCPLYVDGDLYIINKYSITTLDAATGDIEWSFFTGDELYTSLSYAAGKIYLMTSQRHMFILDAADKGTKLDNYTLPSGSWSSPSLYDGKIYIGNHDWNVYCLAENSTAAAPQNNFDLQIDPALAIIVVVAVVVLALMIAYIGRSQTREEKRQCKVTG
ncbi:MAG: PQQ-binding-like beta-propeller repeat protein [Candidatus Bathyarchaeota archaeon]|nr:PQQ-binding-like beta-propeller repeat protein [Candidatus Bathyarchaeota archaeon]